MKYAGLIPYEDFHKCAEKYKLNDLEAFTAICFANDILGIHLNKAKENSCSTTLPTLAQVLSTKAEKEATAYAIFCGVNNEIYHMLNESIDTRS